MLCDSFLSCVCHWFLILAPAVGACDDSALWGGTNLVVFQRQCNIVGVGVENCLWGV